MLSHRVFILLLLVTADALASLGSPTVETLVERADLVVYGRVVSVESGSGQEAVRSQSRPVVSMASVRINPERIFKGQTVDPLLVRAIENMEDSPRFKQGQEVFLFLTRNADGRSFSIIGSIQGKFDVSNGRVDRGQGSVAGFMKKLEELAGQ